MKKFGSLRLFLLLILVLVLSVVPNIGAYFGKSDITKKRLFGEESELKGVLVVWNIDTFEGGQMGKSVILEKVGKEFEKQNKGLYVLIKNMTVDEFLQKRADEMPDVISFGSGLYECISKNAKELPHIDCMLENVEQSVIEKGKMYSYAWCLGAYFVIGSEESLARTGAECSNLVENCMNYGYSKKVGKKTTRVYSVEIGSDSYHSAMSALEKEVKILDGAIDVDWDKQSYYDAYAKFVLSKSTLLVGTQRDIARLENKKRQGAISEIYAEALGFTDLVQYASVTCLDDGLKRNQSEKFCKFLLSNYVQEKLLSFGLFPVTWVDCETESEIMRNAYEQIEKIEVKKIY